MEDFFKLNYTNEIWQVIVPLILMVLDIITGYYNAWKNKKVKSSKMRDGIGKKIAELVYILIGYLFAYAFGIKAVSYFISIYITYMELMSVAENCKNLGVKLPDVLKEKLDTEDGAETSKK